MNTLVNIFKKPQFSLILLLILTTNAQAETETQSYLVSSQASLIGKVFNDKDGDGIQDFNEEGISGIRLATITGLVIETDSNGRYHVPDAYGEVQSWGQNLILKLDRASLPLGSSLTTENPRIIRFANISLNTINFGVQFQ